MAISITENISPQNIGVLGRQCLRHSAAEPTGHRRNAPIVLQSRNDNSPQTITCPLLLIDFNTQPAVWESPSVGRRHGREGKWEVSIRQENGLTAGCIHTTLHVNYVSMPGCRLQLWERHYEPHGGVSQEMLYSPLSSIHKFKIVKWRAVTSEKLAERRSWDIQRQHDVPQFGCDKNGVFASALIHFLFCFPSSPWEWLFFFSFYFSFTIFLMGSC